MLHLPTDLHTCSHYKPCPNIAISSMIRVISYKMSKCPKHFILETFCSSRQKVRSWLYKYRNTVVHHKYQTGTPYTANCSEFDWSSDRPISIVTFVLVYQKTIEISQLVSSWDLTAVMLNFAMVIGWAVLGGIFGLFAAALSCSCVWRLLDKGKWERFQPCGPAHGVAVICINPTLCALFWASAPPTDRFYTCIVLTLLATTVSTLFASLCASDWSANSLCCYYLFVDGVVECMMIRAMVEMTWLKFVT